MEYNRNALIPYLNLTGNRCHCHQTNKTEQKPCAVVKNVTKKHIITQRTLTQE